MIQLQQPNLETVNDAESAHEAFLYLSRQLPGKVSEILDDINTRMLQAMTRPEKMRGIQDFTNSFIENIFQPLMHRIADISPSSPEERSHALREFNHEIVTLPLNLTQHLIDQILIGKVLTVESIKPYVTYALIRNRHGQVFLALSSTKQPIWKQ